MLTYCYAWTPLFIVGGLALLAIPWIGLIALVVVVAGALVLLAGLVAAILWVPLRAGRAILRLWHTRIGSNSRSADVIVDEVHGPPGGRASTKGGHDVSQPNPGRAALPQ